MLFLGLALVIALKFKVPAGLGTSIMGTLVGD
jgi:hypothetical protein